MGCWAIGGQMWAGDTAVGYANAEDDESICAIEAAWDAGVRVFDTASAYGAGHSEELIGQVLGNRDGALIVSKFGPVLDRPNRKIVGEAFDPASIRTSALESCVRLRRDRIDVLLCHINTLEIEHVPSVFGTLEDIRKEGIIGSYGWSTDFPERLDVAAVYPGFSAVEHGMNLFFDAPSISKVSERHGVAQLVRSPLAMGLLTGKFSVGDRIDAADIRSNTFDWMDYFKDGIVSKSHLDRLSAVRDLLTIGGRTPAQGALCWLLAKSSALIPLPGARTSAQAIENSAAMDFGPLPDEVMTEIEAVIDRPPEGPARER